MTDKKQKESGWWPIKKLLKFLQVGIKVLSDSPVANIINNCWEHLATFSRYTLDHLPDLVLPQIA